MYMYNGYYGAVSFDWTYILLIVAMLLSMFASLKVNSTYSKYSKVAAKCGLTAEMAVEKVLQANGVRGVGIGRIKGHLTDNYNPKTNCISLSDSVYGKSSIAAIGVACHEAGHAVQHAKEYGPAKLRLSMVPVTGISSKFSMIILVLGFVLGFMELIWIGIALFSVTTAFQLVTLPTEFDASRRAIKALEGQGIMDASELKGTKKVLSAAALTYVAALAVSVLTLLRYVAMANRRRD